MKPKSYTARQRLDWQLQQTPQNEMWHQITFVMTKAMEAEEGREHSEFESAQIKRAMRFIKDNDIDFFNKTSSPPWMD